MIETRLTFISSQGHNITHNDEIVFINESGRVSRQSWRHRYNRLQNNFRMSLDPSSFAREFKEFLGAHENTNGNRFLVITNNDKSKKVTVLKKNRGYFINGDKVSYANLCKLVSLIILKWDKTTTSEDLDDLVCDFIETPQEITEAIVNKIKYKIISSEGEIVETLMDIDIIGPNECALQLYTDIWVELNYRETNMFIRSCKGYNNKFSAIPFQELYYHSTGEFLTNSQEAVIEAFLIQNKSSTLVTKRSMELVEKLHTNFPNIHEIVIDDGRTVDEKPLLRKGLYIRGKGGSWAVTHHYDEGEHVLGRQNVRTEFVEHVFPPSDYHEFVGTLSKSEVKDYINECVSKLHGAYLTDGCNLYRMGGSICIDQKDNQISLGDQIASRSLLLINDVDNIDTVSTLRHYKTKLNNPRHKEVFKDGLFSLRGISITDKVFLKWVKGKQL